MVRLFSETRAKALNRSGGETSGINAIVAWRLRLASMTRWAM
jgi:hypothetical protein